MNNRQILDTIQNNQRALLEVLDKSSITATDNRNATDKLEYVCLRLAGIVDLVSSGLKLVVDEQKKTQKLLTELKETIKPDDSTPEHEESPPQDS
ncbi:MAG TPA: hypothetical protein DDW52_17045 [Planctomycetaceae bacterium]|nr:hypothetical protein [Planctomycetaceae bacterium]